ncbi:MAG: Smr/MutS family protein [Acidobacteria bacterium]|nr:Smr/MutS family protein [Acidobacteriota bacterium]
MHPGVFRALEFDRVLDALAALASTPLGRARAGSLQPSVDPDDVRARLMLTAEAVQFVRRGGSLAIWAPEDLVATLTVLEVGERPLEPLQLLSMARLLDSIGTVVSAIRRSTGWPSEDYTSPLAAVAGRAALFGEEVDAIRRAIDPSGDVNDHASPALRELRDTLRRRRARLRSTLEGLTRARETAKYLQDQIVTDRNGRYVVVVRAEHRDAVPGIVHGSSTSGASLYLEPIATVELNNEVVTLVERERAEVLRILRGLTDAFRARREEFSATLDVAADADELYAKVELAKRMDGIGPALTADGRLELLGARHPLLIPAMRDLLDDARDARGVVVPSDLVLVPPTRALVISGPNTGGKTVALKAFGLLALMAQSGLFIPVDEGSRFTPFASVFADIGDEQSIAASLSTFSAHITRIVAMNRDLQLPALVLLDEVGSGTDPAEGGALGAALVEHFRRRGALVVATTHDDTLKSYAATTAGVMTAGFGFDPETYAPSYRLLYGAPGRSLAFEIAERLGLPAEVIADARSRQSNRESQLAAHLARIDHEMGALERARAEVEAERTSLADTRAALLAREARLAEREAVLKRRHEERLNEKLREARAEVDRVVSTVKQQAQSLVERAGAGARQRQPALSTGDVGSLRAGALSALNAIGAGLEPQAAEDAAAALTAPPAVGQTVFVPMLGAEAVVRDVSGTSITVELRGKRMRVKREDLRAAPDAAARRPPTAPRSPHTSTATAATGGAARELVLIGATVDEAIDRAEKFLDDALLADERRLRIVHGYGTGRLRDALTTFFRRHPLVASVGPAQENEGGRAATIVELKD